MSTKRAYRILVVDPDHRHRLVMRHGLRKTGALILEAEDRAEALLTLSNIECDLAAVAIDQERNTAEMVSEIRRLHPPLPIIVLSDADNAEAAVQCVVQLGACDWLQKPIDVTKLIPSVAKVLQENPRLPQNNLTESQILTLKSWLLRIG